MTSNIHKLLLTLVLILSLQACGSGPVQYVSPDDATPQDTLGFSVSDLDETTQQLIGKMLESRYVAQVNSEGTRLVIAIDDMKNATTDYIEVTAITDTMVSAVINSGKFRVADRSKLDTLKEELELSDLGFVNSVQASQMGKAIGIDLLLYGRVSSFTARNDDGVDIAYLVNMRLLDIEKNEVVWADRARVRKVKEKSFF